MKSFADQGNPSATGSGVFTVRVAAQDSTEEEKDHAHVVCNTTDADLGFLAALALLPSNGGDIKVADGSYVFGTNAVVGPNVVFFPIGVSNVRIIGSGRGTKFLRGSSPGPSSFILSLGDGTSLSGIEVAHIWFDGNGLVTTNDNGVLFAGNVSYSRLRDCWFTDQGLDSIRSESSSGHNQVVGNSCDGCAPGGGSGISFSAGTEDLIEGNTIHATNFGVTYGGTFGVIANNVYFDNSGFTGSAFQATGDDSVWIGNRSRGSATTLGISGDRNSFIGFRDSSPSVGSVNISGSADRSFFSGNIFVSAITDSGTNTKWTAEVIGGTSPITVTGGDGRTPTISHDMSGVTPGSYLAANISVDAEGHVTSASDGSGGGSGALFLLESHTASGASTLEFTAWKNDADYDEYEIHFIDLSVSNSGAALSLQVSTDGGATYDTGGNYHTAGLAWAENGTGSFGGGGNTGIPLTTNQHNSSSPYCGRMRMYNPGAAAFTTFEGTGMGQVADTRVSGWSVGGYHNVAVDTDAFRVIVSAGTFSGTVRVYGIKKV